MAKIILCNLSDYIETIEEEKQNWLFDVLSGLGVPEYLYKSANIFIYRQEMENRGIEVQTATDGSIEVYKKTWHTGAGEFDSGWLNPEKQNLVAQWKAPKKELFVEGKNTYYKIYINEWSFLNR